MPLPMSFSLIVSTAQEDGEGFFLFPSYEMLNGKYQTDIQYHTDIHKKKKKKETGGRYQNLSRAVERY